MATVALVNEIGRGSSFMQKLNIIESLENEVEHFTKAKDSIKCLPSSRDEQMPEAYKAYNQLMDAYREMIEVRQNLIEELKKGL